MNEIDLKNILDKHLKWLNGEKGGERANLSYADLSYANLSYANLRSADLSSANLRSADLSSANLRSANLRSANLSYANLRSANLSYANLRSADLSSADLSAADLDFSVFPLWCGSLSIKADIRLSAQLAYHFCRMDVDDIEVKEAQQAIKKIANKFHRSKECGEIE